MREQNISTLTMGELDRDRQKERGRIRQRKTKRKREKENKIATESFNKRDGRDSSKNSKYF